MSLLWALLAPALAGGGYEHNHAHVQWRTLETEHFLFHWPESTLPEDHPRYFTTEFTVGRLSTIAEESYPHVVGQFDVELDDKVHVVIYDQDRGWEGNGFAIAEWDWTGFAADWGPTFRERGRMEFLSDVFVHEFAHIVSLKAYLPWSEATTGFGLGGLIEDEEHLRRWGVRTNPHLNGDVAFDLVGVAHTPFWWAEGGAEYWSHQAGYNFWGTSRDAFLRMSVHEDRVLSRSEWTTRVDKSGFEGERGYNHGYAFGLWLRHELGTEAMTDMARVSASRWHWSWDRVVREATGERASDLYARWRAHLAEHYGARIEAVQAQGVTAGQPLWLTKPPWVEPVDDDWTELSDKQQHEALDGETAWIELPVYSPDGRYLAWFEHGLNLMAVPPERFGAIGGEWVDDDDTETLKRFEQASFFDDRILWRRPDFAPDGERIAVIATEDLGPRALADAGLTFNADGYDWSQIAIGDLAMRDGELRVDWRLVPHTLRAVKVAWHPDGETLAFARYGDGTHELWTIGVDGSEATRHTDFGDGTQIQALDWAADGRVLVTLYRHHQQDLWWFEPATGAWERITDSRADETDASVGPDGAVWFASDQGGIFDVYRLDPDSGEVLRQTNLIGGAYGPWPTPEGHLLYTAITGHGFRVHGLPAEGLRREPVDYEGLCGEDPCVSAEHEIGFEPERPEVRSVSTRYSPLRAATPLAIWPVARISDKNVEVGAQLSVGDVVEKHYVDAMATFGKDSFLMLSYWNDTLWPTLNLGAMRYAYKGHYGYGTDLDGVPETTDLQVVDLKFEQLEESAWLTASYLPSWTVWLGLGADVARYSFRDAGDGPRWVPFEVNSGVGLFGEWTPAGSSYAGDDWINPRGGRRLYFDVQRRFTRIVDPEVAGAVYDDGELLSDYGYWRLSASWTEFVPVPWTERHTLQIDLEGGWIDKNVMAWDEFFAGGRHPYDWGSGTIGNNVQFSGYEGWSLTGETLLIANATYRLPLLRDLNWKVGPTYTEAVYFQVFGTVGNLWSFRVEGPSHLEGYSVVPDEGGEVAREQPFRDASSKSSPAGHPNYLLGDVGVELRVRSILFNDWDWDHFLRLSYGLNPTAGAGDVDADLVQGSLTRDAVTELSTEVEPPTLRVYLGIGTGW